MRREAFALILISASVFVWSLVSGSQNFSEYDIKAVFLFNFIKFVRWPEDKETITVCVFKENPFGETIYKLEEKSVQGIRLRVRTGVDRGDLEGCDVVFVPARAMRAWRRIDRDLGPVLTVGEDESFLKERGIINFVLDRRRVRFEINLREAQRKGLKISSKLLTLARRVVK